VSNKQGVIKGAVVRGVEALNKKHWTKNIEQGTSCNNY
jgi:hypothetical protein